MSGSTSRFSEIRQPITEFTQRVKHTVALEFHDPFLFETALADGEGDSLVGSPVLVESLTGCSDPSETISLADANLAMGDAGPEIDENAARLEDALGLVEGMNHAPRSKSSKRPGEDDEVEGLAGELEVLRSADPIRDPVGQTRRQSAAGDGDKGSVRVYGCDLGAHASEAKGEAAVAATYLQNLLASPACDMPQRSNLVLFGINPECHLGIPSLSNGCVECGHPVVLECLPRKRTGANWTGEPTRRGRGQGASACDATDPASVPHPWMPAEAEFPMRRTPSL